MTKQRPMVSVAHHTEVRMREPRCELLLLAISEHTHAAKAPHVRRLVAACVGAALAVARHATYDNVALRG
jgi:hypothetical protein